MSQLGTERPSVDSRVLFSILTLVPLNEPISVPPEIRVQRAPICVSVKCCVPELKPEDKGVFCMLRRRLLPRQHSIAQAGWNIVAVAKQGSKYAEYDGVC